MRSHRLVCAALFAVLAVPLEARADGWWVGLEAGIKSDGQDGSFENSNPQTNTLYYMPLGVNVGFTRGRAGVRLGLATGAVVGVETSGDLAELTVGGELRQPLTTGGAIGVQLDLGFTSVDYSHKGELTELQALIVEPRVAYTLTLGETDEWELGLLAGWRVKLTDGEGTQHGPALGIALRRAF